MSRQAVWFRLARWIGVAQDAEYKDESDEDNVLMIGQWRYFQKTST
jgi:hypothetical protein